MTFHLFSKTTNEDIKTVMIRD